MGKNDDRDINSKDFLIGTLFGAIVGAATALLMAPKTGKELRSDLNQQTMSLREKGNEFASVARKKSSDLAKTVSEQSSQMAGKVRDFRDNMKKDTDTGSPTAAMLAEEAEQEAKAFQDEGAETADDHNEENS